MTLQESYYKIELIHWSGMINNGLLMVKDILKKHPDYINMRNDAGDTALIIASYHNNYTVVEHLLSLSCDAYLINHFGQNALQVAINKGSNETVSLLLDFLKEKHFITHTNNVVNINSYNIETKKTIEIDNNRNKLLDFPEPITRRELLFWSVEQEYAYFSKAIKLCNSSVVYKLVNYLKHWKSFTNKTFGQENVLYSACIFKDLETVQFLVKEGFNIHYIDSHNKNVLFYCLKDEKSTFFSYFIEKNVDFLLNSNTTENILFISALHKQHKIIDMILNLNIEFSLEFIKQWNIADIEKNIILNFYEKKQLKQTLENNMHKNINEKKKINKV